jgi:hypothetical protein
MIRAARLAAALLPLIGLSGLWALSVHTFKQGTVWEVPVAGYDPRDILRGHYVEFTYDWPGLKSPRLGGPQALCLEGTPPRIARVTEGAPSHQCAHPLAAPAGGVYATSALTRGRLYVGQERARELEQQLGNRAQRAIVTIRQRQDGSFTAIAIRFRPLTPAERAARAAPPIMVVPE